MIVPYVIKEIQGVRIAFIEVVTADVPLARHASRDPMLDLPYYSSGNCLSVPSPIVSRVPRVYPWVNASRSEAKAYRRSRSSEACTPLKCHGLARGYLLIYPGKMNSGIVC